MSRYLVSILLALIDLAALMWFWHRHLTDAGVLFVAVLLGAVASAIVQRWRFGSDTKWRARLDPWVVGAFLIGFDAIVFTAPVIGGA